jgi:hypothetical protein
MELSDFGFGPREEGAALVTMVRREVVGHHGAARRVEGVEVAAAGE